MIKYHGFTEFYCDQYDFKCRYEAAILGHTKERHFEEGIQTTMCTDCDNQLSTLTNVKRHIREVHAREVTYLCRHCGKELTKKTL